MQTELDCAPRSQTQENSPFQGSAPPSVVPKPAHSTWHAAVLDSLTGYAVAQLDLDGRVVAWNRAAVELFGYSVDEAVGSYIKTLTNVDAPGDTPTTRQPEAMFASGCAKEAGWKRTKAGRQLWVESTLSPLCAEDGTCIGYVNVLQSSDHGATEAAPRQMTQQLVRLRTIFEASQDATFLTDEGGTIIDVNPAGVRFTGRSRAELQATRITALVDVNLHDWRWAERGSTAPTSRRSRPKEVLVRNTSGSTSTAEVNVTASWLDEQPVHIVTLRDTTDRKLAEAERDRLLRVVESASDFIGIADPQGNIVYHNAAANRALGLPEHAVEPGLHMSTMHPPWAAAQIAQHVLPNALRNGSCTHETVLLSIDGREIPVSQTIVVHRDAHGSVEYTSAIMRDLRGQRSAEALLAKVATQVRGMLYQFELGPERQMDFHYVSPGVFELYGITPESLTQEPSLLSRSMLPEDLARIRQEIEASAKDLTPLTLEYRVINSQGQLRWHRGQSVPERTATGTTLWHGFISDITDAKQAAEEVQRSKRELDEAIAALDTGFAMFDAQERLLACNDRFAELYHLTPEVRHSKAEYEHILRASLRASSDFATWLPQGVDPDDWVAIELNQFRDPKGLRVYSYGNRWLRADEHKTASGVTVCTRTDITPIKEAEFRATQSAKEALAASKTKAEFLAMMSHEIRTPMNGVIGMTNLLIATALSGEQREYVEVIRSSSESLLTLINDILDFSKLEAGKLELERVPFSIEHVVMECISLFNNQAESKGVRLVHRLPETATSVLGDPTRFRQVLLNLVSNALKFTHVGSVTISVELEPMPSGELQLSLQVRDTGIGMSKEHLSRIGDAFVQADASTTRQYGGTGLGLSICRSLVQLMNGTLSVDSELGVGTVFTVRAPITRTITVASEPSRVESPTTLKLGRVLVAEDNMVNQRVIGAMLKRLAVQIDYASSGREAVTMFTQNHYDCILMDGQMPEMDGLEATRQTRALELQMQRPRTPIIALTANALPGDREAFLSAGMDEYLTKPLRLGDLVATLAKVCTSDAGRE